MNKCSRDYFGTVPGTLPASFPEISWAFCLCVSLSPQQKGKHINNLTTTHFRDNPAKLWVVFSPENYLHDEMLPFLCNRLGNQPAPHRGLSGTPGLKCRKSLENVSRGLWPGTPRKSPRSLGTVPKILSNTFRRLSGDFPDCPRDFLETFLGSPPSQRPWETFSRRFPHFGPGGLERPL